MLDGMSDSIQRSRIENLHSREVDRQSPTGLFFFLLSCGRLSWLNCQLSSARNLSNCDSEVKFITSVAKYKCATVRQFSILYLLTILVEFPYRYSYTALHTSTTVQNRENSCLLATVCCSEAEAVSYAVTATDD